MNVDQGNLSAVFTGLKATFTDALSKLEPAPLDVLMAAVPSVTGTEIYPVAALLGDLELVLDEVTITNIGRFIQSVPNQTFARIVQILRNDIADDNIGLYTPAVRSLAQRAGQYHIRLLSAALLAGFAQVWLPDGQTVFSNTHAWPGGVAWDNLQAATTLTAPNFDAACLALETRAAPDGAPLGLTTTHLIVGPANRAAGEGIVNTMMILGSNNIYYQRAQLLVVPRFGQSTAWFVADAGSTKPMLLQNRDAAEFTAQDRVDDDQAFYREYYAYKARRRCAVAILAPWLIQANAGV